MQDTVLVVGQDSDLLMDLLQQAIGPAIGLVGVIITIIIMNRHNRRQLESSNAHSENLYQLRLEELRVEIENRNLDRDIAVSQAVLVKTLDTIQSAFTHVMTINSLLNNASTLVKNKQKLDTSEQADKLYKILKEIREWYDKNCVFLPNHVRTRFVLLINQSHVHLMELFDGFASGSNREVWDTFFEVVRGLETDMEHFMDRFDIVGQPQPKAPTLGEHTPGR